MGVALGATAAAAAPPTAVDPAAVPLFGVISFQRGDLLRRLYNNLDFPIAEMLIVQNGLEPDVVDANRDFLRSCTMNLIQFEARGEPRWSPNHLEGSAEQCEKPVSMVQRATIMRRPENEGCAHGWNTVLRFGWRMGSAYMLVANSDIYFKPGHLGRMHAWLSQEIQPTGGEGFFSVPVHGGGMMPFSMFIATRSLVERIGLYDENIFPVYYEDTEYLWRMNLLGLKVIVADTEKQVTFVHGDEGNAMSRLGGGQMDTPKQAGAKMELRHRAATPMYVANKWGLVYSYNKWHWANKWRGPRDKVSHKDSVMVKFQTPWNDSSVPIGFWEYDSGRRAYIRGTSPGAMVPTIDPGARSCQRRFPQLLIVGLASAGADELAHMLKRHGYFTGPSCPPRTPCTFDEHKAAKLVAGALFASDGQVKPANGIGPEAKLDDERVALAAARGDLAKLTIQLRMQVPAWATFKNDGTAAHPRGLLRARQSMEEVLSYYTAQTPWALPASGTWSQRRAFRRVLLGVKSLSPHGTPLRPSLGLTCLHAGTLPSRSSPTS